MITSKNILSVPSTPGVYFFYKNGVPIYIGKAVNLKARLTSHIQNAKLDRKERAIIEQADSVDFTQTLSDFEAIILEANLVKKYRPQYNIQLKDDKSYLYIKISIHDQYPKITLVRRENDNKSVYFGPFQSNRLTRSLLLHIRKIIPFCTQKKIGNSACFYSKIGLCNPCPSVIEKQNEIVKIELRKKYLHNIKLIVKILNGNTSFVLRNLEEDLAKATKNEAYEDALIIRDKLLLLENLLHKRSFSSWEDVHITSKANMQDAITEFMRANFEKHISSKDFRIECYDISNLFGKDATASMVVFQDSGMEKKEYRRFKIKTVQGISDFAMLQEVLTRRFKQKNWQQPDLLVIDGGPPQLRATRKILHELNINIPMIGIAKHPDRLFTVGERISPAQYKRNSTFFKIIQEIRDESHRFAKKYHLLLRSKKMVYN